MAAMASPHNSIYAPTFYRKRPEIKHIVRDCIPPLCFEGFNEFAAVKQPAQVRLHHYSYVHQPTR